MKKCPFCAEEIQDEAIKCRYCGSMVDQPNTVDEPRVPRDEFEDVRDLARRGEKVAAIKLLRDKTRWDLTKAKAFVEGIDGVSRGPRTSAQPTSPIGGPTIPPSTPADQPLFFQGMKSGTAVGCPSCGRTVRVGEPKCPYCGFGFTGKVTSLPPTQATAPKRTSLGKVIVYVLGGFLLLGILGSLLPDPPKSSQPTAADKPAAQPPPAAEKPAPTSKTSDAECRKSLGCWGEKHSTDAAVRCRRPVEMLAKNSFEWTDGFLEPKFSRYRWKNQATGEVTYIGDKIKYQNGFGAWVFHVYECDLDASGQMVTDVRASPGQIGQ